jgi:RHS repeat-associated protein
LSHNGTTDTPFRFNGRYGVQTDPNGLLYMRARYYNPAIRRFVNQDVLFGQVSSGISLNRFAFANGNPVSLMDPFGLCSQDSGLASFANYFNPYNSTGFFHSGIFAFTDWIDSQIYPPFFQGLRDSNNAFESATGVPLGAALPELGAISAVAGIAEEAAPLVQATENAVATTAETVANPVPSTLARVVDARFVNSPTLGAPETADVFVTSASDIAGINTSQGLASRLTLLDNAGNLRSRSVCSHPV